METIIIGGGQAGLSTSYYLCQMGHEHLILEKASQPANAWRNDRWDSFALLTPNWSIKLPGTVCRGNNPDGFRTRAEIISLFERYIENFDLPVQYDTSVTEVIRLENGESYRGKTNDKNYQARNVVVATGQFQKPNIHPFINVVSHTTPVYIYWYELVI